MAPRPTDFMTNTSFTPTQNAYLDMIKSKPSSSSMFDKYRKDLGIPDQEKIVSGLNRSILDLEGKIKGVEANVNERTKDFFVTEAQRSRRVDVEEMPLRDQYLETLRRREGAASDLAGMNSLLSQRLDFANEDYGNNLSYLEKMMEFEGANKANSGFNLDFGSFTEPKPTTPGGQVDLVSEIEGAWMKEQTSKTKQQSKQSKGTSLVVNSSLTSSTKSNPALKTKKKTFADLLTGKF